MALKISHIAVSEKKDPEIWCANTFQLYLLVYSMSLVPAGMQLVDGWAT